MSVIKTAAVALSADYKKDTLVAANGDIVSTLAEALLIGVIENGQLTFVPIETAKTLSQLGQDLQIAKRVEALPAVATEADLLTLTFGTEVDSGGVGPGDEVPVGTGSATQWFKFVGASQADIANADMWKSITPEIPVANGRYAGASDTMAGAPTTLQDDGVTPLAAKDVFFLTANDVGTGTTDAPEFPRGWYVRNAANTGWTQDALDPTGTSSSTEYAVTIDSAKQATFTLTTALTNDSPIVTLNGQDIEATIDAATKKVLTITNSDVVAIIETTDVLRVRG